MQFPFGGSPYRYTARARLGNCEIRNCGLIKWTKFGSNSKDWLQASGSNRASAAYETAEDASPRACNWSPTCDSNAEAAVSETARYPEIPVSWGLKLGRSPGFDPGPARSQHAMQTTTPRSPSFFGQGGWIRSSGLRLPTPALFQLSYTLRVEALQPSHATPDRYLADVARACETGMRRPWRFHPGRKLAPRSGLEPLSNALTVRCLAMSAIAEKCVVDPLGLEPRPDGLRDRCAAVTPRVSVGKGGGSCIPIIGFGDRGSAVELRPYLVGTSLMNRTSVAAVRSRSAGSTGRGVMLCGALPTESNLVLSRLQGERRRIWLEGRIRHAPAFSASN